MTRHSPCFLTLGERNFFRHPFTRTLKTSYGCGGYTLTGRETGSDMPGRAKTICQKFRTTSIFRAIQSVAVTPRGGADCDDPCHLSWYFCRKTAALKNGRTHHPCLRKNRGRLLWCPSGCHRHSSTSGTSATPPTITSILENAAFAFSGVQLGNS